MFLDEYYRRLPDGLSAFAGCFLKQPRQFLAAKCQNADVRHSPTKLITNTNLLTKEHGLWPACF
jgi:hypothetical protein